MKTGAYSTGEVARLTGIGHGEVVRLIDDGHLPGFRIPNSTHRRVGRMELLKFMLAWGIPTDPLGELSVEERKLVAAKVASE